MRNGAHDLRCRLVLSLTLIGDLPQQVILGPVRYLTSTTVSGRTQCTFASLSGEPKRLSRGGGSVSGMRVTCMGGRAYLHRSAFNHDSQVYQGALDHKGQFLKHFLDLRQIPV